MLAFAWDGPWRPRSAFFQSVVDATGVSRERVAIISVFGTGVGWMKAETNNIQSSPYLFPVKTRFVTTQDLLHIPLKASASHLGGP